MELIRGMKTLPVGGTLSVLSSDPGSLKDIPAWIAKAGHELLATEPHEGYTRFVARKAR
jgi:TusA-related sulfurtransferase